MQQVKVIRPSGRYRFQLEGGNTVLPGNSLKMRNTKMFKRLKNGSLHVKGQVVDCGLLLNGRWHIVMDTGMHFSAPRVDSDKISLTLDGFYTHELCGKSYKKIWNQVNKIVNNN